jgi:hypothetical protein
MFIARRPCNWGRAQERIAARPGEMAMLGMAVGGDTPAAGMGNLGNEAADVEALTARLSSVGGSAYGGQFLCRNLRV